MDTYNTLSFGQTDKLSERSGATIYSEYVFLHKATEKQGSLTSTSQAIEPQGCQSETDLPVLSHSLYLSPGTHHGDGPGGRSVSGKKISMQTAV